MNFASRLEGLASKDQILVSTTTKSRVDKDFSLKRIIDSSTGVIIGFEKVNEYYEVCGRLNDEGIK